MIRKSLAKFSLAAIMLIGAALPARADLVPVTSFDGTNIAYTATTSFVTAIGTSILGTTEVEGVLQLTFDGSNQVTTVNHQTIVPALSALWTGVAFPDTNPTTNVYTEVYTAYLNPITGGVMIDSISVGPLGTAGGDIGIQDDTGVVLNYQPTTGGASPVGGGSEFLGLQGAINIDTTNFPTNPTTYTSGGNTYDFSSFAPDSGYATSLALSFTSSTASPNDILTSLINGGSFTGNATISATAMPLPEPASATLLCMGGLMAGVASRRRRKA